MSSFSDTSQFLRDALHDKPVTTLAAAVTLPLVLGYLLRAAVASQAHGDKTRPNPPPKLPERIPLISNPWQYMTDPKGFLDHASKTLARTPLTSFSLGPLPMTLLSGTPATMPTLFRSPDFSSDKFMFLIFQHVQGLSPAELDLYHADRSGRLRTPAPGHEDVPADKRIWHNQAEMLHEHIGRTAAINGLSARFMRFFDEKLERAASLGNGNGSSSSSNSGWTQVDGLLSFMKIAMTEAATTSLCGHGLIGETRGWVDKFWAFDEVALQVVYGLPRILNPGPVRVRDEFHALTEGYLEKILEEPGFRARLAREGDAERARREGVAVAVGEGEGEGKEDPDEGPDWEPRFGSRFFRRLLDWGLRSGLSVRAIAGVLNVHVFGLNANSIPITAWAMFELIQDQELYAAVREEALSAVEMVDDNDENYETENDGGGRNSGEGSSSISRGRQRRATFDMRKLVALPLLQAVYTECMRLHVAIGITREAVADTKLGGFDLKKGTLVQAPTTLASMRESVWGVEGHPASEFWPGRHIRTNEEGQRVFVNLAKPSEFFPYGGGISMCPGRHFAKQEIMVAMAILVTKFDVEFIEWVHIEDGTKSDRPATDNAKYFGAAAVPPDRDMKIRWRKRA